MNRDDDTQSCSGCVAGLPCTPDGYHWEQLDPRVRAYRRCRAVWGTEDVIALGEESDDL